MCRSTATPGKAAIILTVVSFFAAFALQLSAKQKNALPYGMGLVVNVSSPENEVVQVVQDVVQNGIIRGTKEYNKEEYVTGATAQSSAKGFPAWTEEGKVFYKVRQHALDPRNFKDSGDVGTLAVRYIVQAQGNKNTVLRIDAIFVEEFRHTVHLSNGSVESAEYKDIRDRLDAMTTIQTQTAELERERQEQFKGKSSLTEATRGEDSKPPTDQATSRTTTALLPTTAAPQAAPQMLEERVQDLRRQVERLVKAPGAPLKSAPFHTASTMQSLPAGTEVLIVITTPYWLGVETHDGQHGWMLRDDLELLP
jgi:hypothetical protein